MDRWLNITLILPLKQNKKSDELSSIFEKISSCKESMRFNVYEGENLNILLEQSLAMVAYLNNVSEKLK